MPVFPAYTKILTLPSPETLALSAYARSLVMENAIINILCHLAMTIRPNDPVAVVREMQSNADQVFKSEAFATQGSDVLQELASSVSDNLWSQVILNLHAQATPSQVKN